MPCIYGNEFLPRHVISPTHRADTILTHSFIWYEPLSVYRVSWLVILLQSEGFGQIRSVFILILVSLWAVDSLFFSNTAFICHTVSFHNYVHFGKTDPEKEWAKKERGTRWHAGEVMLVSTNVAGTIFIDAKQTQMEA